MEISTGRVRNDIAAIAGCTATPGAGASRPTFSRPWREALDYVSAELRGAGCHTRTDAAGNLHARPVGLPWDAQAWMSGSHLDSVPHGGDYDGVAGVVAPLEVLRAAHAASVQVPLELVVFAEEEGTTFGLGMLGSRAWVGDQGARQLAALRNADGEDYLTAGKPHGVAADAIATDSLQQSAVSGRGVPRPLGFVEVHIEQGPAMWRADQRIAVVTAIAGRRQYCCKLGGVANHAGSTAMADRQDALAAAAEIILKLESLARAYGDRTVITVGRIECEPNAINVIPGHVTCTIDCRAGDDARLREVHAAIGQIVGDACAARRVSFEVARTESQPVVHMDSAVCTRLLAATQRANLAETHTTISGALHDAAILSPHVPTAMLFIPSRDGISHNPAEFSRIEDIALAAQVLALAFGASGVRLCP